MPVSKTTCLECGSDQLVAVVTVSRILPITARGDSIKVAGKEATVTSVDMKLAWNQEEDGSERKVRGPIYCMDCGAPHAYHLDGKNSGLRRTE